MSNQTATILIVDDDSLIRMSLSQIFAELGYRVRSAEDGYSALLEIRHEVPHLLLCDLNMPGMSGFELLSVVRSRFPAIRLIAMSGEFSGSEMPPQVVADAFYEKATGIGFLFKIVESIGGSALPPSGQHPCELEPVWIGCSEGESSADAYLIVTCPECLRSFPKTFSEATGHIQEARCVYCGSIIPYAIVRDTDSSAAQVQLQKPNSAIPTPLHPLDVT